MASDDPTADEIAIALRVLNAVAADRARLAALDEPTRRAFLIAAGRVSRPERDELRRMNKAFRRIEREADRAADREALERSALRDARKAPVYQPRWVVPTDEATAEDDTGPELRNARTCYICKGEYTKVHFFYDSMCPACGDFNYAKRSQTAPLQGRTALVTGARVKIGYHAALMLLRAGARVIVTTRFPRDAAQRYAQEPDFDAFASRLSIHGLDLRHAPSVEVFTRFLLERESRLDFIINNACQTVRRPPGFYAHLLDYETRPFHELPAAERAVLAAHDSLVAQLTDTHAALPSPAASSAIVPGLRAGSTRLDAPGIAHAAQLSQLRFLDEDFQPVDTLFPSGRYDQDLQQVDLRSVNSWRLTLAEVGTPELLEVHLVNAIAPFILNARLKPLMLRTPTRDKHIVNVSAMEGQFYRAKKTDRHPHTNMAKAALNMMTRTSAPDYAKDGIFMNAVDTGWVTDEDPAVHAIRKAEMGFQPPLDIVDGAARICDPIFVGQLTGEHAYGQFYKDYKPAPW
jgi:NAD(P)-dependent dehydrogenase (short-subunit alcohol dehydrogenase family)